MKTKINGLAAVLNFLIPGLGYIYRGEMVKAFFGFAITMAAYAFLIVPGFFVHAFIVWDASRMTQTKSNDESLTELLKLKLLNDLKNEKTK